MYKHPLKIPRHPSSTSPHKGFVHLLAAEHTMYNRELSAMKLRTCATMADELQDASKGTDAAQT